MLPVIQTGPATVAVVDPEPQGTNQPERHPGRDTSASDRAGVRGDFGLDEYDVEQRRHHARATRSVTSLAPVRHRSVPFGQGFYRFKREKIIKGCQGYVLEPVRSVEAPGQGFEYVPAASISQI